MELDVALSKLERRHEQLTRELQEQAAAGQATVTRLEGMVQDLSAAVDQNRREVTAATKTCAHLATQLEQALNRCELLSAQLQAARAAVAAPDEA
jgi:predicted RNase H-like nuclease (RuvC/YqgF family)